MKSRLPVPVRLRAEGGSLKSADLHSAHESDHVKTDEPQHHCLENEQHSAVLASSLAQTCGNLSEPNTRAETAHSMFTSNLLAQLECLHQECQDKEAAIDKLNAQLAEWEVLNTQLKEKEQLNLQYFEALQAAESTIAYLTACNLDNQGGPRSQASSCSASVGSDSLHSRCIELQKARQDKQHLNNQLIQLLTMAEKASSSSDSQEKSPETTELCFRIETVLQQGGVSSDKHSSRATEDSVRELRRHPDSLPEDLWERNKMNLVPQERLRAGGQTGMFSWQTAEGGSLKEIESKELHGTSADVTSNPEMNNVLLNCLNSAESAISSLAAHCTNTGSFASGRLSRNSSDLQMHLDSLQRALQERQDMAGPTEPLHSAITSGSNGVSSEAKALDCMDLHRNICLLSKLFGDHCQRISELQASLLEQRSGTGVDEVRTSLQDSTGLPPSVQFQLETLHKALREKKKACKNLEEKLASAQSIITKTVPAETGQGGKNELPLIQLTREAPFYASVLNRRGGCAPWRPYAVIRVYTSVLNLATVFDF